MNTNLIMSKMWTKHLNNVKKLLNEGIIDVYLTNHRLFF